VLPRKKMSRDNAAAAQRFGNRNVCGVAGLFRQRVAAIEE
jgi:hypothetical protein